MIIKLQDHGSLELRIQFNLAILGIIHTETAITSSISKNNWECRQHEYKLNTDFHTVGT